MESLCEFPFGKDQPFEIRPPYPESDELQKPEMPNKEILKHTRCSHLCNRKKAKQQANTQNNINSNYISSKERNYFDQRTSFTGINKIFNKISEIK